MSAEIIVLCVLFVVCITLVIGGGYVASKTLTCKLSDWSSWSTCSNCENGIGTERRTRTVKSNPFKLTCDKLEDTQNCSCESSDSSTTNNSSSTCQVSDWSDWSGCSKPCDSGVQTRTRSIVNQPVGSICPNLSETRSCNTQACCVYEDNVPWSNCSKLCDTGVQTKTRNLVSMSPGSLGCLPSKVETQNCNESKCPCNETDWSDWSVCTKTCGGGTQTQTKLDKPSLSSNGSIVCNTLSSSRACNTQACPVDCVMSAQKSCSCPPCASGCTFIGTGTYPCYDVIVQPSDGGASCPSYATDMSGCDCVCTVSIR